MTTDVTVKEMAQTRRRLDKYDIASENTAHRPDGDESPRSHCHQEGPERFLHDRWGKDIEVFMLSGLWQGKATTRVCRLWNRNKYTIINNCTVLSKDSSKSVKHLGKFNLKQSVSDDCVRCAHNSNK